MSTLLVGAAEIDITPPLGAKMAGALVPRPSRGAADPLFVKAIVLEVKKQGNRVRIILSRSHPDFVRRLFEKEIPEIDDGTITHLDVDESGAVDQSSCAAVIDRL